MARAGSSTAVIVALNGSHIQASNLGDSGFVVVRDSKIVFESPPQQHRFNFPYQIGRGGDPVSACEVRVMQLPGFSRAVSTIKPEGTRSE